MYPPEGLGVPPIQYLHAGNGFKVHSYLQNPSPDGCNRPDSVRFQSACLHLMHDFIANLPKREDRVRRDPLSLPPAFFVIAGNMPYYAELCDFVLRRKLLLNRGAVLLRWFHFCYSCRLVARRCHECDITDETYTKLTTANYLWCITWRVAVCTPFGVYFTLERIRICSAQ